MARRSYIITVLSLLLVTAMGCRRTPSYVIHKEEMAQLMADIHVAESYIEVNNRTYRKDSMKMLLKQSVLHAHGVTQEQFDTSMVWYGHNIDKYIDMYDRTIEILQERQEKLGTQVAAESAMSVSGDTVDVWSGQRYAVLNRRLPAASVSFQMERDENWDTGDVYTWRMKFDKNGPDAVNWVIVADYADGTIDLISASTSPQGWSEMVFASDSTRQMVRLRGYADVGATPHDVWVDSIALVRRRLTPELYSNRFRVKHYQPLR